MNEYIKNNIKKSRRRKKVALGKGATFLWLTSPHAGTKDAGCKGKNDERWHSRMGRRAPDDADSACGACQIYVDFLADLAHVFILSYVHTHTHSRPVRQTGKWYVLYQNAHNAGWVSEWVCCVVIYRHCAPCKYARTSRLALRESNAKCLNAAGTCSAAHRISASWTQKNRSSLLLSLCALQVGKKHSCAVALLGNPISPA